MRFETTVLEPGTLDLLKALGGALAGREFVLVGGTALAIQCGHRKSIDLDFFTPSAFDVDVLLEELAARLPRRQIEVRGRAQNSLNLEISGVKVDLIRYAYPILVPVIEAAGYSLLAPPDIAAMKLSAITNRGSRKDFFDLYQLLEMHPLEELLDFYRDKYPRHDLFFVMRSLTYFEDADAEPDPVSLRDINWEKVKQRVVEAVRRVG